MECPKCNEQLEYEEIKWPCGIFSCECGYECDGEWYMIAPRDHEEKLYKDTERMVEV